VSEHSDALGHVLSIAQAGTPMSELQRALDALLRVWCGIIASIFDNAVSIDVDWQDGVVPVWMERVVSDIESVELSF
jgi:hypothetical protein